jgi:hypothetical protein
MKLRLFLDEDVHSGLAHALRRRGYDVIFLQTGLYVAPMQNNMYKNGNQKHHGSPFMNLNKKVS